MRTRSPLDKKTWVVLILVLILLFWGQVFYRGLSHGVSALVHPLVVWGSDVTGGFFGLSDYLSSKSKLIKENSSLREENNRLRVAALVKQDIEKEVVELREKLGKRDKKDSWFLAKVISDLTQTVNDVLLLDVGAESVLIGKINLGDKVLLNNSLILGEIVEVGKYDSKLRLYSAPGKETNVLVGASSTPAVAKGQGSGNFTIELPRGLDIEPNAKVYHASSSKHYLMGRVTAMKKRANNPFQTLYFRYPINFNDLDFVEIHHE